MGAAVCLDRLDRRHRLAAGPTRHLVDAEGFGVPVAFSLAAIVMAGSNISTERELGTWDALRLTSVNAAEIVNDTLTPLVSGLRRYWLALLPAVITAVCKQYGVFSPWESMHDSPCGRHGVGIHGRSAVSTPQSRGCRRPSSPRRPGKFDSRHFHVHGERGACPHALLHRWSIGLFGCLLSCMVASRSEGLLALLLMVDIVIISMLFFAFFGDINDRNRRSGLLCHETIENLVKHHGFEREPASIPRRMKSEQS